MVSTVCMYMTNILFLLQNTSLKKFVTNYAMFQKYTGVYVLFEVFLTCINLNLAFSQMVLMPAEGPAVWGHKCFHRKYSTGSSCSFNFVSVLNVQIE